MNMRIKVYPSTDYLLAFLQRRDILIVEDDPEILHFAGTEIEDLKDLVEHDNPDFVVSHTVQAFKELPDIPQAFHPVTKMSDFNTVGEVWTNNFELCRLYYRKLGLQTKINLMPLKALKKKEELRHDYLSKLKAVSKRLKKFMLWD